MGYSDIKELLTDAKNFATGANDLQLKSVLLDIQSEVFSLQEENRNLRDKITELENEKNAFSNLVYHQGVYSMGENLEEAYCAVCWDRDKNLVRVRKTDTLDDRSTSFVCDVCNTWRFSDIPWQNK